MFAKRTSDDTERTATRVVAARVVVERGGGPPTPAAAPSEARQGPASGGADLPGSTGPPPQQVGARTSLGIGRPRRRILSGPLRVAARRTGRARRIRVVPRERRCLELSYWLRPACVGAGGPEPAGRPEPEDEPDPKRSDLVGGLRQSGRRMSMAWSAPLRVGCSGESGDWPQPGLPGVRRSPNGAEVDGLRARVRSTLNGCERAMTHHDPESNQPHGTHARQPVGPTDHLRRGAIAERH